LRTRVSSEHDSLQITHLDVKLNMNYHMTMIDVPFGDAITEVVLPHPPLIMVLSQIRFPPVASVGKQDFIAPFQEAVRRDYPILRKDQEIGLIIAPAGVASAPANGVIWRLLDKEQVWRLSLAPNFVALETQRYNSHSEFSDRFAKALEALKSLINPIIFDRLGLRYVNRFHGAQLPRLRELVRPELLGFVGVDIGRNVSIASSILQTQFEVEGAVLLVRGVNLGPGAAYDPTVPVLGEPSWILDIDAYTVKPEDFGVSHVVDLLRGFADRSYRLFRWSVTEQLIVECGGRP